MQIGTVQNKLFIILFFSEENILTVTRPGVNASRKDDFTQITFTVGYHSKTEHLSITSLAWGGGGGDVRPLANV